MVATHGLGYRKKKLKTCTVCQDQRKAPEHAPLHPWEWPDKPWRRLHIDYAGPFMGKIFLIVVDAHSKWLDVYPVASATAAATVESLRSSFSTHGIPEMIVSDNAPCFVSERFQEFVTRNGITHVTAAPYHPSSNGLAERAVQTFKELMKKSKGETLETKVNRALFSYRIIPQTATGRSPAELMMGRKLRCLLDFVHPDLKDRVARKQAKQKEHHDKHNRQRIFEAGDLVYTRNYTSGPQWIPGLIEEMTGPVSYRVVLGNRRHVDQLFCRTEPESPGVVSTEAEIEDIEMLPSSEGERLSVEKCSESEGVESGRDSGSEQNNDLDVRRSQRPRKPPAYMKDYVM
uniref:Integrase catalytic domain-containing protein n=1 Tax=Oryzias melastigma TaxID=30732 RepID=A0A3B3BR08_ORYME